MSANGKILLETSNIFLSDLETHGPSKEKMASILPDHVDPTVKTRLKTRSRARARYMPTNAPIGKIHLQK